MAFNFRYLRKALAEVPKLSPVSNCTRVSNRTITTTTAVYGKRNFRKFHLGNKRGTRIFRRDRNAGKYPDLPIETLVRPIGFMYGEIHHPVKEMIPELVVPDLTDCELKPYVSYRAGDDLQQEEFTVETLYDSIYAAKLEEDYKNGKLDENGNPLNPSEEETLSAEDAWIQARKTGSDLFSERIPKQWECLDIDVREYRKKKEKERGYNHWEVLREPLPSHKQTEPPEMFSASSSTDSTSHIKTDTGVQNS